MSSREFSVRAAYLSKENRKYGLRMERIPESAIPVDAYPGKNPPVQVWRSMFHLAQVFKEEHGFRISICRTMIDRSGEWLQGIDWDEIQSIKSQLGFGDQFAIEVYPEDSRVVNVANMRHIWVLSSRLDFAW